MLQIVLFGLLAITAVIVLINLFKGLIRGLKKTVGTLAAIIISVIVAAIVTAFVCTPISSLTVLIMEKLQELVGEGELNDIFAITELGEALSHYLCMIIAPIFFVLVYAVVSIIVSIVVAIVIKFIPPHKKPCAVVHRLGGLGVGVVCGIIVSLVLLMPVVGVLNIAVTLTDSVSSDTSDVTFEADESESLSDIKELIGDTSDTAILDIYNVGCGWLYDSLASTSYNGERVYLKDDLSALIAIVSSIQGLGGDMSDYGDEQLDTLDDLVDNVDRSPLIKHMLAGVLSDASGKWLAGETFIGVSKFSAGELLDPTIDTMLGVMATSDVQTVGSDLRTMADIFKILIRNDMLSNSGDYEQMLKNLGENDVIKELLITANRNERMSVISDEIAKLSIRALASAIGVPENEDERYNDLMNEIASILNESAHLDSEARYERVLTDVVTALDDYGVKSDGEAAEHIVAGILADLGDIYSVKGSDVEEFFMMYAVSAGNGSIDDAASDSRGDTESLADSEIKLVLNVDGTVSIGDRVLKNYNAANYSDSTAFIMGKNGIGIGDARTLYSAKSMNSSLVMLNEICLHMKKFSECADPNAEAEKISDMVTTVAEMFSDMDNDDIGYHELIEKMGALLDEMCDTEIFGKETMDHLLRALVQSKSIRDEMGLTTAEATDFANKLNELVGTTGNSYADATGVVSNTIDMIDAINDESLTNDERTEKTSKLISNMDQDKAEMLSTMVTPSMMVKYGSSQDKAETVSSSVSTLFNNMAEFSSNTADGDEAYKKEADAVNKVLTLAMDGASSNEKSLFNDENGNGKIDSTADEFVDLLVNSEVVSNTINETVYEQNNSDNPYGVNPSEKDSESLTNALNDYYDNNSGDGEAENEELQKKLNAIAVIVNVEPPFTAGK